MYACDGFRLGRAEYVIVLGWGRAELFEYYILYMSPGEEEYMHGMRLYFIAFSG